MTMSNLSTQILTLMAKQWRNILGEKKSDYLTYPACHFCTILPHPMDRLVRLTTSHCLIKSTKK